MNGKNLMPQKPEMEIPEPHPHPSDQLLKQLKVMGGAGTAALAWLDILVDEILFLRKELQLHERRNT